MNTHTTRARGRRLCAAAAALGLLGALAACGGDDDSAAESTDVAATEPASLATTTPDPVETVATTASASVETTEAMGSTPAATSAATTMAEVDPLAPKPLAEPATIRLGIGSKAESLASLWAALELGEFAAENVTVEISVAPLNDILVLAQQGDLDVVTQGVSAGTLNLLASGDDLRFVFPGGSPAAGGTALGFWARKDILGDDGVLQPAELPGVTIATVAGEIAATNAWFWKMVDEMGGGASPADVTYTDLAYADAANAIVNGAVQVAFTITPFNELIDESDCCVFLSAAAPTVPASGYVFGPNMNDPENLELGQAFVRAMARTVRDHMQGDYEADPDVLQAISTQTELPAEQIEATPSLTFEPEMPEESLTVAANFFESIGILDFDPTQAPTLIDSSWIDAVTAG